MLRTLVGLHSGVLGHRLDARACSEWKSVPALESMEGEYRPPEIRGQLLFCLEGQSPEAGPAGRAWSQKFPFLARGPGDSVSG